MTGVMTGIEAGIEAVVTTGIEAGVALGMDRSVILVSSLNARTDFQAVTMDFSDL